MINPKDYYEAGLQFHGHKCPAMPMGLRVGAAAMNRLGVDRAKDGQLIALIEIGDDHCATCFADGVQMITGCTFGKGNIQKLHYGKWGITLIDRKTKKAIRVSPKAAAMKANKESSFFKDYREKGIPASEVPNEVVQPLVDGVMSANDEDFFIISEIFDFKLDEKAHSFEGFVCEVCGEMTVEPYGRLVNGKHVCIPCQQELISKN